MGGESGANRLGMDSFHPVALSFEPPFSLEDTLKSGQLFHWEEMAVEGIPGYAGCIGSEGPCWVAQPDPDTVLGLPGTEKVVRRYFGLDQSPAEIRASFPQHDEVLREAVDFCPGIRVARQPPWECLATFITSSLKQVAHIRAMSLALRTRFGRAENLGDRTFHAYPTPGEIAAAGEGALRECALGYRAKSLHLAAESIGTGRVSLEEIENAGEAEARELLLELHGVGEKIANCVLLFSCGHWGAFPIDVWIERILRRHYRKRLKGARLQAWAVSHFGENAGYAQQYLFHFARKTL